MINSKRALVLAPHTDDAELGCGGTIAKLIEGGTEVYVAVISTAEESLPKGFPPGTLKLECLAALPHLGVPNERTTVFDYPVRRLSEHRQDILEDLVKLRSQIKPDLIFLPSQHDKHQDHEVVSNEGFRAFKDWTVLGYELPWNLVRFDAQAFVHLEASHVGKKIEALNNYVTQVTLQRPYFQRDFLEGWARSRGVQVKASFAEAFEVMRMKW